MSTHSVFKEFDDSLKTMIGSIANNNPAPKEVRVTDNSFDSVNKMWFADISVNGAGMKRVKCLGYPRIGAMGILIFIGGNYESPYLLCNPIDTADYEEPVKIMNLLPNGTFKAYNNNKFEYWTGGIRTTSDAWYDNQCVMIQPNKNILSDTINIETLRTDDNELTLVMVYYLWRGGSLELTIQDVDTGRPVTLPPENLNITTEKLPSTDEWRFNRTLFYLREHKNIRLQFHNSSTSNNVLLDGVRVWNEDYEDWHPSMEDENL